MGYTVIMNPTADQVDVGDVMFYDSTYTGEINHTTIITSKVDGVPRITGHTSALSYYIQVALIIQMYPKIVKYLRIEPLYRLENRLHLHIT